MRKLWLLCLLLLSQPALAHYPMHMWQAERKAAEGKWAEAAQLYGEALKEDPKSAEATYNLALCLYRQGQFDKAEPLFKKAQELAPPGSLKGQSAYNLGNAQFRQKKLKEALESYKVALRWNELDDDARYNIQVVLDQLKPPPPKKQPPKDKKDPKKDPKKEPKKDPKKDPKKEPKKPDPKKEPKKPDPKKPGDQPKPKESPKPGQGSPTPTPTPPPPAAPKPQDRDKEDAERLLQFFQNREKQAQKRRVPAAKVAPSGEDDW